MKGQKHYLFNTHLPFIDKPKIAQKYTNKQKNDELQM